MERGAVGFTEAQAVECHAQFHIAADGGQFARQRQDALVFAQTLSHLAGDFIGFGEQLIQCAVLA